MNSGLRFNIELHRNNVEECSSAIAHPKNDCVLIRLLWLYDQLLVDTCDISTHLLHGCIAGNGMNSWLAQRQRITLNNMGKYGQGRHDINYALSVYTNVCHTASLYSDAVNWAAFGAVNDNPDHFTASGQWLWKQAALCFNWQHARETRTLRLTTYSEG